MTDGQRRERTGRTGIDTTGPRAGALALVLAAAGCAGGGTPGSSDVLIPRAAGAAPPPNIVLLLVDDLGVNDLRPNPAPWAPATPAPVATPHIDSLARDGLSFLQAYAPNAMCAPSRAALLTGRYQQRFGLEYNPGSGRYSDHLGNTTYHGLPGLLFPERAEGDPPASEHGLPPEEITIAELLREHGYATGHFGKWHLGFAPRFSPESQGFDISIGIPGGGSRYVPKGEPGYEEAVLAIDRPIWDLFRYVVVSDGRPVETREYQTDLWADRAIDFIRERRGEPFFAYVAFNAPHNPLQAPRPIYDELGHIEDHTARVYYAMMVSLDRAIGRILAALDETGVAERTLVVFASDNGGAAYTDIWTHNLPFRGFKLSFWEGGIRTPLYLRWPERIRAGSTSDNFATLIDLLPTFADAAAAPLPQGVVIDGRDLLGPRRLLADSREPQFWRSGHVRAMRDGRWKVMAADRPAPGRVWLYDLESDPLEQHDLADEQPERASSMLERIEAHYAPMPPLQFHGIFEIPVPADPPAPDAPMPTTADYLYWPG